ncbi:MAG TPA: hypothetical protein VIM37_02335 [Candidatus Microsaccharimonas sp.]|jgi:hypothetical protein
MTQPEFFIPEIHPIIVLEQQPDFPGEDLSENNADMLRYYLRSEGGLDTEVARLYEHQRVLFEMARLTLWLRNIEIDDAPKDYQSFTHGFASYELIQSVVTGTTYDTARAAQRANKYLITNQAPEIDAAQRSAAWPFERPNLYGAIATSGEARGETMKQLHARVVGAQLAFELQRPQLDAA